MLLLAATGVAGCAAVGAGGGVDEDAAYPPAGRAVRPALAPPVVTEESRDRDDEARRVAELLRLTPGQRIVELEAGTGYYAFRFARALGPASPIVAADATPSNAMQIEARAMEVGLSWLSAVLTTAADPRLPPGAADIALIGDRYATIREPYAYFARLVPAIAPGGRLAIVALDRDVRLGGIPFAQVRCELEALGYELEVSYRLVPVDRYLAVFIPPDESVAATDIRSCPADE